MGKVKAWMMEQQEEVQFQFIEGEIDARLCATKLAHLGMEPDDIEMWIDEVTAERAQRLMDKVLESTTNLGLPN
jgi:hypothetical protein